MQTQRMYVQTETTSRTVWESEAEWPCSHRMERSGYKRFYNSVAQNGVYDQSHGSTAPQRLVFGISSKTSVSMIQIAPAFPSFVIVHITWSPIGVCSFWSRSRISNSISISSSPPMTIVTRKLLVKTSSLRRKGHMTFTFYQFLSIIKIA